MKTQPIFIAAMFLIMLQSCQKELSLENGLPGTPTVPTTIDSNYLSKILYLAVVNGVPTDTAVYWVYTYDNLKRVTSVIDSSNTPSPNKYFYYYTGTDTMPYKSVLYQNQVAHDFDTIISYHYFDNVRRKLKDSIIFSYADFSSGYNSGYRIQNYSYGNNRIYGFKQTYNFNGSTPDYRDTATLDARGNIIDNKRYRFDSFTNTWELDATSTFTFDTNPSPFSNLSNFKTYAVFPSGETLFFELPFKNNKVSQHEHHSFGPGQSGGVFVDWDYINIYKPNGFLKDVLIYDLPPVPGNYLKLIFIYKAL